MARLLSETDIDVLKRVAPECKEHFCSGPETPYHSILPVIVNYYSKDTNDFRRRINLLSRSDLEYLVKLILLGDESLGCLPFEYRGVFLDDVSEKLGKDVASQVKDAYWKFDCPD